MKKIVLIDDDSAVRFLLPLQLNELGYEVESFEELAPFIADGLTSNRLANTILLLDVNLPNLNGDVFLRENHEELSKIENLSIILFGDQQSSSEFESSGLMIRIVPKHDVIAFLKSNQF